MNLIRKTCRVCGSKQLLDFSKLKDTPLADKFIIQGGKEDFYPLEVKVCSKCFLVQQVCDVPGEILYGSDYGFFSAASPSSIKYFEEYGKEVIRKCPSQSEGFIVEIASNDGLLLKQFPKADVLGVDPAEPAAHEARKNGVPTKIEPFSILTANDILNEFGEADLIIANNVVAHVIDVNNLMGGVEDLLSKDGVFVMECQYLPQLLFNNEFDHIYHEHRSFFSMTSLNELLTRNGLRPYEVIRTPAQGGSIRVYCTHSGKKIDNSSVNQLLIDEIMQGIKNPDTYKGFDDRVEYIKTELLRVLKELKTQGKTVYGYGASAKSCTLLNHCGIGTDLLDCIVDKTPYKIGKLSPGMHIPIVDNATAPDYYLLLVWNYLPGILKREREFLDNGGHFLVPIATPYII